jgi:hypothetical protein
MLARLSFKRIGGKNKAQNRRPCSKHGAPRSNSFKADLHQVLARTTSS